MPSFEVAALLCNRITYKPCTGVTRQNQNAIHRLESSTLKSRVTEWTLNERKCKNRHTRNTCVLFVPCNQKPAQKEYSNSIWFNSIGLKFIPIVAKLLQSEVSLCLVWSERHESSEWLTCKRMQRVLSTARHTRYVTATERAKTIFWIKFVKQ